MSAPSSTQNAHDHQHHESFIRTPKQLIVVIVLSFLVPIISIVLIVSLVTSGAEVDPAALQPEAVAARIQPVGAVEIGTPAAPAGARSGEQIAKTVCAACHDAGVAGAPRTGDKAAWAPRIKQGFQQLLASALNGKGAMPPKGGDASLTESELARAVAFMANQAGASFKAPAEDKPQAPTQAQAGKPAPAAAAAPSAAGEGKKVYETACVACHATGVANAPKLGDKAAWAPRLKQGMDTLFASALQGKGAMPPKGGNLSLSDAAVRAAVEYMAAQSK